MYIRLENPENVLRIRFNVSCISHTLIITVNWTCHGTCLQLIWPRRTAAAPLRFTHLSSSSSKERRTIDVFKTQLAPPSPRYTSSSIGKGGKVNVVGVEGADWTLFSPSLSSNLKTWRGLLPFFTNMHSIISLSKRMKRSHTGWWIDFYLKGTAMIPWEGLL